MAGWKKYGAFGVYFAPKYCQYIRGDCGIRVLVIPTPLQSLLKKSYSNPYYGKSPRIWGSYITTFTPLHEDPDVDSQCPLLYSYGEVLNPKPDIKCRSLSTGA